MLMATLGLIGLLVLLVLLFGVGFYVYFTFVKHALTETNYSFKTNKNLNQEKIIVVHLSDLHFDPNPKGLSFDILKTIHARLK